MVMSSSSQRRLRRSRYDHFVLRGASSLLATLSMSLGPVIEISSPSKQALFVP